MDNCNNGLTGKDTLWRSVMTGVIAEMTDLVYQTRWLFILALVLVLIDFWFGISVSKAQNIPIRWSRAGRRTINKAIDYLCYIILGIILGKAFGEPFGVEPKTIALGVMFLCCGFEIDSIWSHICVLHGIKKPISIWKVLLLILSLKFKSLKEEFSELGDKLEETIEGEKRERRKPEPEVVQEEQSEIS